METTSVLHLWITAIFDLDAQTVIGAFFGTMFYISFVCTITPLHKKYISGLIAFYLGCSHISNQVDALINNLLGVVGTTVDLDEGSSAFITSILGVPAIEYIIQKWKEFIEHWRGKNEK